MNPENPTETTESAAETLVIPTTTEEFLAEMEAARTPQEPPQEEVVEEAQEEVATAEEPDQQADDASDELERLRSENALYESLMGDSLTKELGLQEPEPEPEPEVEKEQAPEVGLLEPMEFTISEEEEDALSVGDAKTMKAVLDRRASVTEHNMRLQMNQAIAQGIMWWLPVANATTKFAERNPEFVKLPNAGQTVSKLLAEARRSMPHADEATLVRNIENKLSPALKRVKQIVSDVQKRKELGPSQSPAAKQPAARNAAPGASRQPRALTGAEEAALLIEKMAARY